MTLINPINWARNRITGCHTCVKVSCSSLCSRAHTHTRTLVLLLYTQLRWVKQQALCSVDISLKSSLEPYLHIKDGHFFLYDCKTTKTSAEHFVLTTCLCFARSRFSQWFWGVVEMVPETHGGLRECECKRFHPILEVRAGSVCSDPPLQTSAHVSGSPGISLVFIWRLR